jgi:hypothetical protein
VAGDVLEKMMITIMVTKMTVMMIAMMVMVAVMMVMTTAMMMMTTAMMMVPIKYVQYVMMEDNCLGTCTKMTVSAFYSISCTCAPYLCPCHDQNYKPLATWINKTTTLTLA